MILADSSVWIDYFRGIATPQTDRLDGLLDSQGVIIGDLVLVEVLQGFLSDITFAQGRRLMSTVPIIEIGGHEIAVQAANNYRALRTRGITIRKTIDTLIATRCIVDGIQLLYSDRDFDPFVTHLGLQPCPAK